MPAKRKAPHRRTAAKKVVKHTPHLPDALGKICFYLAAANIEKSVKEAWITVLPTMTVKQRERLANILEAQFLNAATRSIDDDFQKELERIRDHYVTD